VQVNDRPRFSWAGQADSTGGGGPAKPTAGSTVMRISPLLNVVEGK